MSQPWINNSPEVDWHGNNGSQLTGPECASSRYTEARLSKIAEEGLFTGIGKENVKMIPNFSEDDYWPEVLPATLPRLMVNGCQGIGSTIANVWLNHNLKDVAEVLKEYLLTNEIDFSHLYPDFPSGGTIINKDDIHEIYETGKGKAILRGKVEIKDKDILITELPYQVYVQPYIEKVTELAINGEITGIEEIHNESGKNKLLIRIECFENPFKVLKQLYSKTDLQKSYSANQWALVGKTPRLLTLKDYCQIYKNHNIECLVKEITYDLNKAKKREHILEGLIKALEDIDNIIQLIKKSENSKIALSNLMSKYNFSEEQGKAILGMKLSSLAHLEAIQLNEERNELLEKITEYNSIINSTEKQIKIILDRLESLVKKYGVERKTEVVQINETKDKDISLVEPEKCVVVMTESGLIKRIPAASYRTQKRNGVGVKTQDDITTDVIRTNTIDVLMIFSNKGKVYRLLVDDIPEGNNTSKGFPIKAMVTMEADEQPEVIYSIYREKPAKFVILITEKGLIKKVLLEELIKGRKKTGTSIISIEEGDRIVSVALIDDEQYLIVGENGQVLRADSTDLAPTGKTSKGVIGIRDSKVIALAPIRDDEDEVALFSKNGFAKKVKLSTFTTQKRGGKGVMGYKITDATGPVVACALINDGDNILVCGDTNSICIKGNDIPEVSKVARGNIVIKNNNILSVSKV